jgi:hypothetical protein
MRLTAEQINNYKQVILSGINGAVYEVKTDTDKEKMQFVYNCFYSELYKWQSHKNIQTVFAEWLQGLPSACYIPFYNSDIIELAEKINGTIYTDKQADKILENYWRFMTGIFFRLFRQYKIKF